MFFLNHTYIFIMDLNLKNQYFNQKGNHSRKSVFEFQLNTILQNKKKPVIKFYKIIKLLKHDNTVFMEVTKSNA